MRSQLLSPVRRSRIRGPGIGLLVEYGPHIVLTCATLPNMSKSRFVGEEQDNRLYNGGIGSAAWTIKRWFPNAVKVNSAWVHRRHPSIVQTDWVYIEGETDRERGNVAQRIEKTLKILKSQDPGVRTIVFCKSAESCMAADIAYKAEGIACTTAHTWMSFRDRIDALKSFAMGKTSVLICTDRISRGIDLPVCRHVIQLEFATTAVDHLHRVGRAARAGRMSKTTNLWGDPDVYIRELVMKTPAMGLDGHLLYRFGHVERMRRVRKRFKRQEFAYGECRKLARLARIHTQNKQGEGLKTPRRIKIKQKDIRMDISPNT